jgi:hypothetical protein
MIKAAMNSDTDPEPVYLDGEHQVKVEITFGDDPDHLSPGVRVQCTLNKGYRTPVFSIVAPHPGIRLDIYDYRRTKIYTTLLKRDESEIEDEADA